MKWYALCTIVAFTGMIIIVMHVLATDVSCTGMFNYSSLILVIMEFTFLQLMELDGQQINERKSPDIL